MGIFFFFFFLRFVSPFLILPWKLTGPGRVRRQGAERSRMHGQVQDVRRRGCLRTTLLAHRRVPRSNAGVVGGVIHRYNDDLTDF